jgi:hypothetical protein
MSLKTRFGNLKNVLDENSSQAEILVLESPFIANAEFNVMVQQFGEQVAFIDIESDHEGICRAGLHNPSINLGVTLSFRKSEMPWLTNWQHFGRGEYVTGIEPCTHPPIGQSAARANNTLIFLQPGETKTYHLTIDINL